MTASLKKNRTLRIILFFLALMLAGMSVAVWLINRAVLNAAEGKIYSVLPTETGEYDAILVLGAGVREDGSPSNLLDERLRVGIAAYQAGLAPLLLMSGDSQNAAVYDETGAMRQAALDAGVPEDAILTDGLGLSTRESLRRAKEVYGFDRLLIVTQSYHLPRALFIAEALGVEAVGVNASFCSVYSGEFRELAARVKDYIVSIINN